MNTILLVKESRAGECRVALVPCDAQRLIEEGYAILVESDAGLAAGYPNELYQQIGAKIVDLDDQCLASYISLFSQVDMIVRVKRADRIREQLEAQAMKAGTLMIGALDPFEVNSTHIDEYHAAGILAYSIDQARLPVHDPMNVLAAMSRFAGQLALQDACAKHSQQINKVVIIGLGVVGQSALEEALHLKLPVWAVVSTETQANSLKKLGVNICKIDRSLTLIMQQKAINQLIMEADIVIASARRAGQRAPLLIPKSSLDVMKSHAVVVDMAISEGGNVEGSRHDETVETANNVLITNVSGYPKSIPHETSVFWSRASLGFILGLANPSIIVPLQPC